MNKINCFGFSIFSDSLDNIPILSGNVKLLTTISPNSYGIATKDNLFRDALKQS